MFGPNLPWLAPLAGYSDLPFRLLCRERGAAVCETEMISARGLVWQSPGTGELLRSAGRDKPLVAQLFGGDAASMGEAVTILRKAGYVFFDCNMGCPVRKVLRQKAGGALVADPAQALAIARAMLTAAQAPPWPPARIGFKLRLPPEPEKLFDLARWLEDAGAAWLTLHPRSAAQGYGGVARHEYTMRLAPMLGIPLLASGDLLTGQAGVELIRATGAAGVMYARGALLNPDIFREHVAVARGEAMASPVHADLAALIRRHIELTRLHCGEGRAFFKMRSIIPRYVKGLRGVHELRQQLGQCDTWERLEEALAAFLAREE